MAVDMFLDLGSKIKGESKDETYTGTIDVLAWSWGMSQSGSFHSGGGGGAGKVNVQDISLTKYVDSATANLMLYCANGDHFEEGKLIVRKSGKKPLDYLVIKMEKVMVTSVSTGGSGGEDRLTENCTINFAKCSVEYTPQKDDGSGDAAITWAWDIAANAEA